MRLNRNILLGILGGIFVLAALVIRVAVYAQQTQSPARSAEVQEAAEKKAPQIAEPAPTPHPQQEAQQQPSKSSAQAIPQFPAAPQQPASVFSEHIRQAKITTCANVFGTLGLKLANNSSFTAKTRWDPKASDAHSIQSILALSGDATNPAQHAAGVVFAAPIGQSCEGALVRVTPTSESCQKLGAGLMQGGGSSSAVGDLSMITLPNDAQVLLLPFGDACIAVTTLSIAG